MLNCLCCVLQVWRKENTEKGRLVLGETSRPDESSHPRRLVLTGEDHFCHNRVTTRLHLDESSGRLVPGKDESSRAVMMFLQNFVFVRFSPLFFIFFVVVYVCYVYKTCRVLTSMVCTILSFSFSPYYFHLFSSHLFPYPFS